MAYDVTRLLDNLFIGSALSDGSVLEEFGITVHVNLIYQPPMRTERSLVYLMWPIEDSEVLPDESLLEDIASRLSEDIRQGRNVLITCGAGLERSALLAAKVMERLYGRDVSMPSIVREIRQKRPGSLSNPWFVRFLLRGEQETEIRAILREGDQDQ